MGDKIIEVCINTFCTTLFWDECKENVKAMYETACIMDDINEHHNKAKKWLNEIFECFDDWYDRKAFKKEFENYLNS